MPIIRKLISLGASKAVTLPKGWLTYKENELGTIIEHVTIEINEVLKITPYIPCQTNQIAMKPNRDSCLATTLHEVRSIEVLNHSTDRADCIQDAISEKNELDNPSPFSPLVKDTHRREGGDEGA